MGENSCESTRELVWLKFLGDDFDSNDMLRTAANRRGIVRMIVNTDLQPATSPQECLWKVIGRRSSKILDGTV